MQINSTIAKTLRSNLLIVGKYSTFFENLIEEEKPRTYVDRRFESGVVIGSIKKVPRVKAQNVEVNSVASDDDESSEEEQEQYMSIRKKPVSKVSNNKSRFAPKWNMMEIIL